jgi:hypothetical protein
LQNVPPYLARDRTAGHYHRVGRVGDSRLAQVWPAPSGSCHGRDTGGAGRAAAG